MSRSKATASHVRVSGPLVPFVAGFRDWLEQAGYTPLSADTQVRLLAHLSQWLEVRGLGVSELTEGRIHEFLLFRRSSGRSALLSPRCMLPLVRFLTAAAALPPTRMPPPASPMEALLDSFQCYLLTQRGVAQSTAGLYLRATAQFLGSRGADHLAMLSAADVAAAVAARSSTRSVSTTQGFALGLRSFLRFCFVEGHIDVDLSAAALGPTGRRISSLPRGINPADARALLAACDRRRSLGRRNYAVILILLRLGLRAGEVAQMCLDDIDWRSGELVVHGKGRRDEALPLPADVAEAIVAYLKRGRPQTSHREVFLRASAPRGPLSPAAVSQIVRRASLRAGIAPVCAHRLRHTAACDMLRAGATLSEISQVLRHRSLATTALYARVDLDALRSLAQPWPGGDQR